MSAVINISRFTEFDVQLFQAGKHFRLYQKFGAHLMEHEGVKGTYFAVWAPNALFVSVICDSNQWNRGSHPLYVRLDGSGIWEGFVPGIGKGEIYKYFIHSSYGDAKLEKGDPYAFYWETPPRTGSIVWDEEFEWSDAQWMEKRRDFSGKLKPFSVYEVHMGSWLKLAEDGNRGLSYREHADQLVKYVVEMGFTHVELMPVMEHPYQPSWGYQITGYFAPTSRFGTPTDFQYLVDRFHAAGIGVLLDWVPSHFPEDIHGLALFDGTRIYEHPDPSRGYHPDWTSLIFNYGSPQVRSFLISNALFWLDRYHVEGLRVDAVASMLYRDYSRKEGQWQPNEYGGRENLEAISFLKELNETVYRYYPDAETIAEESTAFPGVSHPTYKGGLGFGQKWMMGWMHDTLKYFKEDPLYRRFHHDKLTFSLYYAFSENFIQPLSHDEVVHGKSSLIGKMPGDEWQRFANLRLLYGWQWAHPGNQLLFMGCEFGQTEEWSHERGVDWFLLKYPLHSGVQKWVRALNKYWTSRSAFHEFMFSSEGFRWVIGDDNTNEVFAFLRFGADDHKPQLVVLNATPNIQKEYRVGVPYEGVWIEQINSDLEEYGGSGVSNGKAKAEKALSHGYEYSVLLTLPPLGILILEPQKLPPPPKEKNGPDKGGEKSGRKSDKKSG